MLVSLFSLAVVVAEEEEGAFRMFSGIYRGRISYPQKEEVIREKEMIQHNYTRQVKPVAEARKPVAKEQSDPTTKRMSFLHNRNEEFPFVSNSPPERIQRLPKA